ncbi:unnamed protein product [Sphagnum troendelagicum]|uniref:diphthine methyl ester synthase n=1 Tax=Sphagnum troendelagicum TaxID=128251 RepID=A0ABP0TQP6_9BRYO
MLYVVGLGLGDERDITLRGLEAVRKCDHVYLEAYTSLLALGLGPSATTTLEKLYGRPVLVADREMVEQGAEAILEEARNSDVAFLVVGDPFGATTHSDLLVRAKKLGVAVEVVHNASIMNAVGACGLQLYRFGEAISIPFFTETWRPASFYDKIKANHTIGLHTLCLLDIRVKEQSMEALCRGKKEYEPPKYMSINTALGQLLEIEETRQEKVYNEDTLCVGLARLGTSSQKIVAGSMKELLDIDFGPPLHSLVIVGDTHVMEEEFLTFFRAS